MGSVNQNLRGIRLKVAVFGTPKSGKYSFLHSMCKITSTQGNLQLFSDESGDVFSFVPIVRSVFSESINLQVKMMGARDRRGDGLIWQSIFKDVDGLIFVCRARNEFITQIAEYLHKMQEYLTHFGPRDYHVPVAIFYNKYETDVSIEELDKKVNQTRLRSFSGDLSDILPFISAVRYVVKDSLRKHQSDYEKFGGKKNIEEAFEIVEVFRPAGVQIAESSVIISPPEEPKKTQEIKMPPPPPAEEEGRQDISLREDDIEVLSELVEEKPAKENTVRVRTPVFDFTNLSDKQNLLSKMIGEIEQASQFFTLKVSDLKKEYLSLEQIFEQIKRAYDALRDDNRNLEEKFSELKTSYEEALAKLGNADMVVAEKEKLQRIVEEEGKKSEALKNRIFEFEKQLTEKERIIQDKESLLAIKITETDELRDRIKILENEREKAIIERRSLEDKLIVLESKYKSLEEERNKLNEEISKMQEETLACRAESEELQTNLGIKEREIEELKKASEIQIEKLKSEIAVLSSELASKTVPSNDEEVRRLSSELVNLQIEIAQKDDRIRELEESLNSKIREIEELKASKPHRGTTTTETISPQMLAKTIISNLKLKYWDDMIASLKDGTFQKKYNPVFVELKKAYDSKIPESTENRDAIFQAELRVLLEELKKSV
ncbi:MAG: hypothetical protein N3B13_01860 [Deltaproteobacteria bacterium]|nr:hypothetical protein [Deltaproteobacteria bacterium]